MTLFIVVSRNLKSITFRILFLCLIFSDRGYQSKLLVLASTKGKYFIGLKFYITLYDPVSRLSCRHSTYLKANYSGIQI
jgi:hypothetical protein